MTDGVTLTELARLAGMSLGSIRYHRVQGHIRRLPNGRYNPADAELLARARQVKGEQPPDGRAAKLLKARALGGAVKTRRLRLALQEAQARVVEHQQLAGALAERCSGILARVDTLPARYAEQLAGDLGVSPGKANEILVELARLALDELGDLHAEAARYVGQSDTETRH